MAAELLGPERTPSPLGIEHTLDTALITAPEKRDPRSLPNSTRSPAAFSTENEDQPMDSNPSFARFADYPKPGIMFRDVTTLLGNARAFRTTVDLLVQPYAGTRIDKVAGIEARGFILAGAVAHQLSVGFVPVRKKGKLPREDDRRRYYELEYGTDAVEIHADAVTRATTC